MLQALKKTLILLATFYPLFLIEFLDLQPKTKPINTSGLTYSRAMMIYGHCDKWLWIMQRPFFDAFRDSLRANEPFLAAASLITGCEQGHWISSPWFNYANYSRILGPELDLKPGTSLLERGEEFPRDNVNLKYALISLAGVCCAHGNAGRVRNNPVTDGQYFALMSYYVALVDYYKHRVEHPSLYNK